jgi:peroxiredoxin
VDYLDANRAWGDKLQLTYPLLSDNSRNMLRAYDALNEDPALQKKNINTFLRAKRAWYVIDKLGIVRYMNVGSTTLIPADELIEVVKKYN